jgi:hypothetical protein
VPSSSEQQSNPNGSPVPKMLSRGARQRHTISARPAFSSSRCSPPCQALVGAGRAAAATCRIAAATDEGLIRFEKAAQRTGRILGQPVAQLVRSARARRASGRYPRQHQSTRKTRRRAQAGDRRGGQQGAARGSLFALSAEAADEGSDRARSRPRTAASRKPRSGRAGSSLSPWRSLCAMVQAV